MTVEEAIEYVDNVKPNAFSQEVKTKWLSDCEGRIQSDVFLQAPVEFINYKWPENKDWELLVSHPHDKLYLTYLEAMVDYSNGEYSKYQNTMEMFNTDLLIFSRWFSATYRPADTWRRFHEIL